MGNAGPHLQPRGATIVASLCRNKLEGSLKELSAPRSWTCWENLAAAEAICNTSFNELSHYSKSGIMHSLFDLTSFRILRNNCLAS